MSQRDCSNYYNASIPHLTCWLLYLGGIGRSEGGHGSRSSGEPVSQEVALPSPALFHTSAVGQSNVMAWNDGWLFHC